jgi:hypothetical protein
MDLEEVQFLSIVGTVLVSRYSYQCLLVSIVIG